MNTSNRSNKGWVNAIKIFLASLSITSLFGLWNLFNRNAQESRTEDTASSEGNALTTPLPTLMPSVTDNRNNTGTQELAQVDAQQAQPTSAPVIERVVIGSSGGSSGGAPAARTASS